MQESNINTTPRNNQNNQTEITIQNKFTKKGSQAKTITEEITSEFNNNILNLENQNLENILRSDKKEEIIKEAKIPGENQNEQTPNNTNNNDDDNKNTHFSSLPIETKDPKENEPNEYDGNQKPLKAVNKTNLSNLKTSELINILKYCSNNELMNLELTNSEIRNTILHFYEKLLGIQKSLNDKDKKKKKKKKGCCVNPNKLAFYEIYCNKIKIFSYNKISAFYNLITNTNISNDQSNCNIDEGEFKIESIKKCLVDSSKLFSLNKNIFTSLDHKYSHLYDYVDCNSQMINKHLEFNIEEIVNYCNIIQIAAVEDQMFVLYKKNLLKVFVKNPFDGDHYQLESSIKLVFENEQSKEIISKSESINTGIGLEKNQTNQNNLNNNYQLEVSRLVYCSETNILFLITNEENIYYTLFSEDLRSKGNDSKKCSINSSGVQNTNTNNYINNNNTVKSNNNVKCSSKKKQRDRKSFKSGDPFENQSTTTNPLASYVEGKADTNKNTKPQKNPFKLLEIIIKPMKLFNISKNSEIIKVSKLFCIKNFVVVYSSSEKQFFYTPKDSFVKFLLISQEEKLKNEEYLKDPLLVKSKQVLNLINSTENSELQEKSLNNKESGNNDNTEEVVEEAKVEEDENEEEDEYALVMKQAKNDLKKKEEVQKQLQNQMELLKEKENYLCRVNVKGFEKVNYSQPKEFSVNKNSLMFLDSDNNVRLL